MHSGLGILCRLQDQCLLYILLANKESLDQTAQIRGLIKIFKVSIWLQGDLNTLWGGNSVKYVCLSSEKRGLP